MRANVRESESGLQLVIESTVVEDPQATAQISLGEARAQHPDCVVGDVVEMPVSAEFWGGLAVGLGIATQLAALAIMGVMSGSMYHHIIKWKSPYWAANGGWEYDLMWFTMCLVIVVTGGGTIAIWPIL